MESRRAQGTGGFATGEAPRERPVGARLRESSSCSCSMFRLDARRGLIRIEAARSRAPARLRQAPPARIGRSSPLNGAVPASSVVSRRERAARIVARAPRLSTGSGREPSARYGRLGGSQFAAAISYRALFSLIPLATFAATVLAAVLQGNDDAPRGHRRHDLGPVPPQLGRHRRPGQARVVRALAVERRGARHARARAVGGHRRDVVDAEVARRRLRRGRVAELRARPARQRLLVLGVLGLMLVAVALLDARGRGEELSESLRVRWPGSLTASASSSAP